MKFTYRTSPDVCSSAISIEIADGKLKEVQFDGGCPGNLQAVSKLIVGMTPEETVQKLEGIRCGGKATSCPDQLARALKEYLRKGRAQKEK
ncbi:MAG: TIGR03905 family TSCPD domain-containing protein [Victivallaceae bacterium]|nr:TIGR03905 family TSCPD domain-containing protein [Victivallaceae bacterium]